MNKKTITLILTTLLAVMGVKADVIPSSYYSEPAAGTYYLYNITQEKFLCGTGDPSLVETPTSQVALTALTGDDEGKFSIMAVGGKYYKMGYSGSRYLWGNDWTNNGFFKWTFSGTISYKLSITATANADGKFINGNTYYTNGEGGMTESEAEANDWALITDANYKLYLDNKIVPIEYRSDIPATLGSYYVYDIINKKFLKTTTWPPSMNDEGELITFTPSEKNSESGFLISGRTNQASPEYIKIGYAKKETQCVWSNTSSTNTLWKIAPVEGEASRKAFYIYTDNYDEKDIYYGGATQYLISGNASTTRPIMSQWVLISATDYESWKNIVTIEETENFTPAKDVFAVNVTVNRTMTANVWNTLVVPFDMTIPSGWTVMEPTEFKDGTLTFGTASSIVAGKPYIVKPTETVTSFSATGVTLKKDLVNTTVGDLTMTGTYEKIEAIDYSTQNSYIIGIKDGNSSLYKVNSAVSLKPFRAYFTVSGNDPSARVAIRFDDDTTGINVLEEENANENTGMKDGKYLENGRIIIVKNGVKYSTNGQIAK